MILGVHSIGFMIFGGLRTDGGEDVQINKFIASLMFIIKLLFYSFFSIYSSNHNCMIWFFFLFFQKSIADFPYLFL